jgi:predicted O-methyltransferase YrrM
VGQLLQVLLAASDAKKVLEIGTLFGYSAVLMGRALPADARLLCLEVSSKHAEIARQNVQRAGLAELIEIREGNAVELLPALAPQSFDFVFIDADKPGYPEYLEWALTLTHPGSLIVADNVWRRGEVVTGDDENARAMDEFNRSVAENPRLTSVIVPRPDGTDALSISVVKR